MTKVVYKEIGGVVKNGFKFEVVDACDFCDLHFYCFDSKRMNCSRMDRKDKRNVVYRHVSSIDNLGIFLQAFVAAGLFSALVAFTIGVFVGVNQIHYAILALAISWLLIMFMFFIRSHR